MDPRRLLLALACAACRDAQAAAQGGLTWSRFLRNSGQLPEGFRTARTGKGAPAAWSVVEDPAYPAGVCWRRPARIRPTIASRWRSMTRQRQGCRGHGALQGRGRPGRSCRRHRRAAYRCRQLLCRSRQCAGGQRQLLSCRAGFAARNPWRRCQGRVGSVAHAEPQGRGRQFTIGFDGKTLFTVTDRTFAERGKVALWTKADSVTRFDALTIRTIALIQNQETRHAHRGSPTAVQAASAERPVRQAADQPLREQLWRCVAPAECDSGEPQATRLAGRTGVRDQRHQARGADCRRLGHPARDLLRRTRRRGWRSVVP